MTTARDLIGKVAAAQGRLTVKGDRLVMAAPCPLPADLIEALRAHKAEILAYLTRPVPTPEEVLGLRPETIADAVQRAHLAKMSFGPAARIEEVLPA